MEKDWVSLALYRPQIPQNTGNIGRTCVGLNVSLHIIGRPGFSLEDKDLKRAGLDYWEHLSLFLYEDFDAFFQRFLPENCYFLTKRGKKNLFQTSFQKGSCFVLGMETDGLPSWILEKYAEKTLYLPMTPNIRSYNLANSAAVVLFEAYRQIYETGNKGEK